ncbi:hypothetical protein [Trichothermofontia sp.]
MAKSLAVVVVGVLERTLEGFGIHAIVINSVGKRGSTVNTLPKNQDLQTLGAQLAQVLPGMAIPCPHQKRLEPLPPA